MNQRKGSNGIEYFASQEKAKIINKKVDDGRKHKHRNGYWREKIGPRGLIRILPILILAIVLSNRGIRKALISLSRFCYTFLFATTKPGCLATMPK